MRSKEQVLEFPTPAEPETKQNAVGAALRGRPHDGQPRRVAPRILMPFCVQFQEEIPGSYTRTLEELGANPAKPTTAAIIDASDKLIEAILASEEIKGVIK
jgi:hypothetical protein